MIEEPQILQVGHEWHERPSIPYTKYFDALYDGSNDEVKNYLIEKRKFSPSTLAAFKIGVDNGEVVIPVIKDGELIDYKWRGIKE
jgi:hypothetical protein